jgi:hypothetical protein
LSCPGKTFQVNNINPKYTLQPPSSLYDTESEYTDLSLAIKRMILWNLI